MKTILPVLLVSCIAGFIGTGVSIYVARSIGIMDRPGEIKIHDHDVPRFGGLGILLGTALTMVVYACFYAAPVVKSVSILVVSIPVVLVGAIDDIQGLSPKVKLLGQITSSFSISMFLVNGFLHGTSVLTQVAAVATSAAFICFLTNSINLVDGMDGLASGIAAIVSLSLAGLAILGGHQALAVLPVSLAGACLGFMFLNLPPARTFMGDIGSNFLGYVISAVALQLITVGPFTLPRIIGIGLILLVPIGDTTFAIIRRLRRGGNPFTGDRLHLYDCLHKRLGGRLWTTLAVMWTITFISCVLGVTAALSLDTSKALLFGFLGVVGIFLLAIKVGSLGAAIRSVRSGLNV